LSTAAAAAAEGQRGPGPEEEEQEKDGPRGDLFAHDGGRGGSSPSPPPPPLVVGRSGWVRRTFGPRSNAEAMLACGGESLAAHASFDPDYRRAQGWIRRHAVGPAVLSPVLASGLVGALVEAAFPQSVPDSHSLQVLRPIVVGVEVVARIEVVEVTACEGGEEEEEGAAVAAAPEGARRRHGHTVRLATRVSRERDGLALAVGSHSVWIPDYLRM
jgi:hypothetical protein